MEPKITDVRNFHIIVKSTVSRAFAISSKGEEIEMKKTRINDDKTAFDGVSFEDHVTLRLLGNKKTATYENINSVVSIPITKSIIDSLKNSGGNCLRNSIIVNTPSEVRAVVVDFPKNIKEFIMIPDCILLREIKIVPQYPPKVYENMGLEIGEKIKNWNSVISIKFPNWVYEKEDKFIEELLKIPIEINCYLLTRDDVLDVTR